MEIDYFVDVNIALRTGAVALPAFDAELFLVDSETIPRDKRIKVVTWSDVEDLPEGSVERDFADTFYSQIEKADRLVLGRLITAALPPAFVCADSGDYSTDPEEWSALETWSFSVSDGTHTTVVSGTTEFAGVTNFAQVLGVLNDELGDLVAPDVVGLNTASFAVDSFGRLVLTMPTGQDEGDPNISIAHSLVEGTVPWLMGLREEGAGESLAGMAIESITTSYSAIKEKTSAFYNVALETRHTGDGDYTPVLLLAARIEQERRQATFVDCNPDAEDGAEAGDLQSQLALLSYQNSLVLYTQHDDYPDAAADGAFLPADPCTQSYGHTPLTGCLPSGSTGDDYDLDSTGRAAIEEKGGNYIARSQGYTFVHRGRTANGNDKRAILVKHWLESGIQADVFALDMNSRLMAFDAPTLGAIGGILKKWLDEAVNRRGILSYTLNMPSVESFSALEKASGDMVLSEVFSAIGNSEAHTFQITGSISLGE